jgi:hypothetical protein
MPAVKLLLRSATPCSICDSDTAREHHNRTAHQQTIKLLPSSHLSSFTPLLITLLTTPRAHRRAFLPPRDRSIIAKKSKYVLEKVLYIISGYVSAGEDGFRTISTAPVENPLSLVDERHLYLLQ